MLATRSLGADTDLPALQRLASSRYPLLLESSAAGTAQGRWDILLAADGGSIELARGGAQGDFLDALDAQWQAARLPREEPRWPFRGGWALFLAYELAGQVEPVLDLPAAPGRVPMALATTRKEPPSASYASCTVLGSPDRRPGTVSASIGRVGTPVEVARPLVHRKMTGSTLAANTRTSHEPNRVADRRLTSRAYTTALLARRRSSGAEELLGDRRQLLDGGGEVPPAVVLDQQGANQPSLCRGHPREHVRLLQALVETLDVVRDQLR